MGRSTRIWGPTAHEFNPARWLDENNNIRKESPAKYPTFHHGPRTCLGQQLATVEAVTVLVLLLTRFRFELVPGQKITYSPSLTLPMKGVMKMRVYERM